MRKESHKPAGQRRTTNCASALGQVTLEGNAQTEELLKVKKYSCACPVLGLVSAFPWAGRPPVLGLVAWQGGGGGGGRTFAPVYRSLLHTLVPFCFVSRFPLLQEIPRRTRFLASYAIGLQHCVRRCAVASNAARVAWINGSNAVWTPGSDPLERAMSTLMPRAMARPSDRHELAPRPPVTTGFLQCLVRCGVAL